MWLNSQFFQHIFGYEALEDIYESLQNDDHTEVVMKLHEKLKHAPFEWHLEKKSVEKSDACRRQGNDAFKSHSYCQALIFYNRALCYAPKNSRSLILAYSNRSALLYELKEFKDALKDIKMCYQLGCPDDLVQKLKIREEKCYQTKRVNDFTESLHKIAASSHTLLTLGPSPSNEIPCASKMVKLDTSGVRPKVVASENIDVGTVVALETPFVNTFNSDLDAYRACYHCMKTSLNLIPCNNCCLVMFCAENCEKESLREYHAVECKLLHKSYKDDVILGLKAVIKIRNKCSNWNEFIEVCSTLNSSNQTHKNPKTKDLFSDTNPFSLLYNTTYTYVRLGTKTNYAAVTAVLVRSLDEARSFFPAAHNEKVLAMRATAKLLMHLFLYSRQMVLRQSCSVPPNSIFCTSYYTTAFSIFLGKLEHSCHPNLIVSAMNNKAVVTALQPIRRGTTLTISYVDHYLLHKAPSRLLHIYAVLGTTCSCKICSEEWDETFMKSYKLSPAQEKLLQEVYFENMNVMLFRYGFKSVYQKMCLGLKLFADLPHTIEYKKFFSMFIELQCSFCCAETNNKTLQDE